MFLFILYQFSEEKKKLLDEQSNITKEQTELLNKIKLFDDLNEELKKDNMIFKERNEQLEKMNAELVNDISKNTLLQNEIQKEKESKFKEMCITYDNVCLDFN